MGSVWILYMVLQIGHGEIILKPYGFSFSWWKCESNRIYAERTEHVPMTCLKMDDVEI